MWCFADIPFHQRGSGFSVLQECCIWEHTEPLFSPSLDFEAFSPFFGSLCGRQGLAGQICLTLHPGVLGSQIYTTVNKMVMEIMTLEVFFHPNGFYDSIILHCKWPSCSSQCHNILHSLCITGNTLYSHLIQHKTPHFWFSVGVPPEAIPWMTGLLSESFEYPSSL